MTDQAPSQAAPAISEDEPPEKSAVVPPWVRKSIYLWWGVFVGLWAALIVVRQLRGLLVQLTLALFLSFALEPLVNRLQRRGLKRGAATGISLLGLIGSAAVFVGLMGQLVATQLTELVDALPGHIRTGQTWLNDRLGLNIEANDLIAQVEGGQLTSYANDLSRYLLSIGSTVASLLFQTLTVGLFTYYLTADGPRLRRMICSLLPPARQVEVLRVWELAIDKTGAYISSRMILGVMSAVFHWIVFLVLGLPSPVALAIWVGVISQFIPTLGTYLAGILPAIVAIGISPITMMWVLIAVIAYQQVENYLLQPRITAQTLDLHPAVAIGAVLAGTSLFGAPGALLALPVVATAGGFVSAYVERHPLVESRLVDDPQIGAKDEQTD